MNGNERLVAALQERIQLDPDVELIKLLHFVCTIDDPDYIQDIDIAEQLEFDNKYYKRFGHKYEHRTNDANIFPASTDYNKPFDDFTKENEQIAYDRYKTKMRGRVIYNLTETLPYSEFLMRFTGVFCIDEIPREVTVINHCSRFIDVIEFRHHCVYTNGRKGDKYIAMHQYACKIPDFRELFESITFGVRVNYEGKSDWAENVLDDWFSIAVDWEASPRFTDYTRKIAYGVWYRPAKKEVEIFNADQTVEIFHELMQKSNIVYSEWQGTFYDDKTFDLWE